MKGERNGLNKAEWLLRGLYHLKKELCSFWNEDGHEEKSDFMRLEFHECWYSDGDTLMLNWLESAIHDGKPALILHCHYEKEKTNE